MKSYPGSFNLSAFDPHTNTLVIYNPIDNFLRFFNCSREIEKFKDKISLILHKSDTSEDPSDYKLIKSRNSFINIIEKNVNLEKFMADPSESPLFSPFLEYLVKNKNLKKEPCYLRYWFSKFFTGQFNTDDTNIFEKDELITISSLSFLKNKEPIFILGTSKGKVYVFPIFFEINNPKYRYYLYAINEDKSPINVMYFRKEMMLFSNEKGRFFAIEFDPEFLAKKEEELMKSQTHKKLIVIDLAPLKKTDQFLLNPIKRILQVKPLAEISNSAEEKNEEKLNEKQIFEKFSENEKIHEKINEKSREKSNEKSSSEKLKEKSILKEKFSENFEKSLALILENNSIAIFSLKTYTIDYILKANDGAILGVFFHRTFDQIFVLNSTGEINIWSISTGNFERNLAYSSCFQHFNLKETICSHSKSFANPHNYNSFKGLHAKSISKLHSILEFNIRNDEKLIDYCEEDTRKRGAQLNNERFGDLARILYSEKEAVNLIWMLNYANDLIFEAKNSRNGCSCLKMKLSGKKNEKHSDIAHILLIDCKKNLENYRRILENKEENRENSNFLDFLSFLFPFGADAKIDEKIFKKIDNKLPVFNFCIGVQGMGESFSFLMRSGDNWSASSYLSTIQAIAITVFLIFSLIFLDFFYNFTNLVLFPDKHRNKHSVLNPADREDPGPSLQEGELPENPRKLQESQSETPQPVLHRR